MKTGIKTAVILATVFTGTLVVEAQQQRNQQQNGRRSGNRIHQCPNCGWSPQRQQSHKDVQAQGQRSQQRQQFRSQTQQPVNRRNYQNQARQNRSQGVPQQRQQTMQRRQQFQNQNHQQPNQRHPQVRARQGQGQGGLQRPPQQQQIQQKRQQLLKRFDADNDGKLSEQERIQLKNEMKHRQSGNDSETKREHQPKPANKIN